MSETKSQNTKPKYGKSRRADSTFEDSIQDLSERSCTDIPFCIVFAICILMTISCSIVGYVRGDPKRLLNPTDSAGRHCGEGELKDKDFLFFFDLLRCSEVVQGILHGCATPMVCVSKCPTEYFTHTASEAAGKVGLLNDTKIREKLICTLGVQPLTSTDSVTTLVLKGKCAPYYVPSSPVLKRCIPSIFLEVKDSAEKLVASNFSLKTAFGEDVTYDNLEHGAKLLAELFNLHGYAEILFRDFAFSWPNIIAGLAIVFVVSLVWIFLLKWLVEPIVWFSFAGLACVFISTAFISYREYYAMKVNKRSSKLGLPDAFMKQSEEYSVGKYIWLGFGCSSATVLVLLILVLVFLGKKIHIACELISEACTAIAKMPLVVLAPVIPCGLQLVIVGNYVLSVLYIASIGEPEFSTGSYTNLTEVFLQKDYKALLNRVPCNPNSTSVGQLCKFVRYGGKEFTDGMQVFLLFMFFWTMDFTVALGQLTLAGAFASFYWATEKSAIHFCFAACTSLWRALRYHMGSLALGSFLTALVQLFRSYLDYVDRKLRRANNTFAKFILKCLMCCIWVIERLLKYVNQNAYIMIAVYGRGYISSSKNAFNLIMRNVFQTVIVDKVSDFIMILSRLLLTGAAATGSYIWFHQRLQREMMEDSPDFDHALVPVIVMVFGTILLTANVFSVYDMAVNTLFLCFLEDLERNNGSVQKPYYMSKSLLKLLRKGKGGTEVEGSVTILDALKDPGRLRRISERADHTAATTRISTVSRRQKALEGQESSDGSNVDDTRY